MISWLMRQSPWVIYSLGLVILVIFVGWFAYLLYLSFTDQENKTQHLLWLTAGIVGWYFLYHRTKTAIQSTRIAEQGLTVDRLNRATEQLASDKPSVRLGGILGLEQISDTREKERMKIARILVSFIRTQAAKNSERSREDLAICNLSKLQNVNDFSAYRAQRLDIEAAVNALANITSKLEKQGQFREEHYKTKHHLCDLQNTDLRGLRFIKTDLSKFIFAGADMSGAWLADANLTDAWLYLAHTRERTQLIKAFLEGTNFNGAFLNFVNFRDVEHLKNANFKGAFLFGANFTGVQMIEGNLNNSELEKVNFTEAFLSEVKIYEAKLNDANLTDASFLNMQGLRQYQLDDAFRWKGHNTFVTSTESDSLRPPPEKEKPQIFWVYKIWKPASVIHARIHVPWCPFCNNGKGTNRNEEYKRYRYDWTRCNNYEEAVRILENFKEEHNCDNVKNCGYCESRGDLPPP